MAESRPSRLKIEVKTSRDAQHQLGERDLDGIRPDGYVAVLLMDRVCRGPRWVLVPGRLLAPGGYADRKLDDLSRETLPELTAALNRLWSDWILDESVWMRMFQQTQMDALPALEWCLRHHRPRANKSQGNIREGRIVEALGRFRSDLDKFVKGSGAQQEGQVHQRLLSYALVQVGYQLSSNPIGVPDISALWCGSPIKAGIEGLRGRLQAWDPAEVELREVRALLLGVSDSGLRAVHQLMADRNDG